MLTINIIIRGFLYKEKWIPLSSAKHNFLPYTINFKKLLQNYEKLFNILSKNYNLKITFTSYNSTPLFMQKLIKKKGWDLYLINENNSKQFTACCKFLEKINTISLILRSDLILTDKFIKQVSEINFKACNKIIIINQEPNGKYNDVFHIVPVKFKTQMISILKDKKDGHKLGNLPIEKITTKVWTTRKDNIYYKIYRDQNNQKKMKLIFSDF